MNVLEINTYTRSFSKKLEEWTKSTLFSDFSLQVTLDWSKIRTCSRGGMYKKGPGINIAMACAYPNNNGYVYRFLEYPSYDRDSEIGGFYAKDPKLKLNTIVAHEVAHAIQMHSYKILGQRCTPHGAVFKSYYKMLRTRFVNPSIPTNQLELAADYNYYKSSLTNAARYITAI